MICRGGPQDAGAGTEIYPVSIDKLNGYAVKAAGFASEHTECSNCVHTFFLSPQQFREKPASLYQKVIINERNVETNGAGNHRLIDASSGSAMSHPPWMLKALPAKRGALCCKSASLLRFYRR